MLLLLGAEAESLQEKHGLGRGSDRERPRVFTSAGVAAVSRGRHGELWHMWRGGVRFALAQGIR